MWLNDFDCHRYALGDHELLEVAEDHQRRVGATRLDVERELLQRYIAVHGRPELGSLAARGERRA